MLKYFLVIVVFGFMLISCGEKKEEPQKTLDESNKYSFDSTDLKTQGVDNSGKPFKLEYKFKKGDNVTYRLTTISDNSQTITMDTTISTKVNQKIVYLLNVNIKDVDDEGTMEAEVKITSVKLDAIANGKVYAFEAGKDKDSASLEQYAEFQSLYNNAFSVRFNKLGEVLEVYKVDKISNKFLELRGALDTISTSDKNLITQNLTNSVLTPLITQVVRKTTDKEVYKDSTWQMQQKPVPLMVYQMNFTNIYKISSVEKINDDKIAVIDADIKFTYTGNPKVNQPNASYSFQKPISTADGKIYFDVDKGLQMKAITKTRLEISYSMEGMTPQGKQKGSETNVISNTNILEML